MKKFILLMTSIWLSVLLQGCVPAVFVAGAAVGISASTIVNDVRPTKVILADQRIAHNVKANLLQDDKFKNSHVSVSSYNRIVLLVGQTPTSYLRDLAENRAKAVPDVRLVHNEITINAPTTFTEQSKDTWITTEAKTILIAQPGLKSSQIKIITENSVIYLMGLVNHHNADIAVEKVRSIDGVQKVVKLFEYTK